MKCFCTPRQKCPLHHEEYEPEIHGPDGRDAERAEILREITKARNDENRADEGRLLRELLKQ